MRALREEADRLQATVPFVAETMAAAEGTIADLRIHVRGSHWDLGEVVPRRLPRVFGGDRASARFDASSSGRLELAAWITKADHPLTSRVMANRIWRWLFGAGLVRSTDNFGKLGDRPTHPELLDWLALRFVESGWSVKSLVRILVTSSAYPMSAALDEAAVALDPENRLHWRHPRRRLEVEAIRDALLAASGDIDFTMGGSLLVTKNREYVATTVSTNATTYDSPRRSVYLPVVRSALYEVFQAFDFADPSTPNGDRDTTTVAPQALFMLNSALAREASRSVARRVAVSAEADDARVDAAYRLALGRSPSAVERADALAFLERYSTALVSKADLKLDAATRRMKTLEALAHALLSTNEFIHVE